MKSIENSYMNGNAWWLIKFIVPTGMIISGIELMVVIVLVYNNLCLCSQIIRGFLLFDNLINILKKCYIEIIIYMYCNN